MEARDLTQQETSLIYSDDEVLEAERFQALAMLRLSIDRYDVHEARKYSRRLNRIEQEIARRRFDYINQIHCTMCQEGGR
jgi:hypothetical protein